MHNLKKTLIARYAEVKYVAVDDDMELVLI